MTERCNLCEVNAGRTSNAPCCQLRSLALAPEDIVKARTFLMTAAERDELRPRYTAEQARLKTLK